MRVLQFGFDSDERDDFLPHNYPTHCVAYTGTHDNDTATGWWSSLTPEQQKWVTRYLAVDGTDISGSLNAGVWQSRASVAITPLQTLLRLGADARTNRPGTPGGNWQWRFEESAITPELAGELRSLNERYDRIGG
jgi:4-alpha-glucanotransferase